MRLSGRSAFLLMCLVALVWQGPGIRPWLDANLLPADGQRQGRTRSVNLIRTGQSLRFALPPQAETVRILSNLILDSPPGDDDTGSIYKVIARPSPTGEDRSWTHRVNPATDPERFQLPDSPELSVLPSRSQWLHFKASEPSPSGLSILVGSFPDEGAAVAVRVYVSERLTTEQARRRWLRATPAERRRLAAGNVHAAPLLDREQQLQAARYVWTRLSPEGIAGQDFEKADLRILAGSPPDRVADPRVTQPPHTPDAVMWIATEPGAELRIEVEADDEEPEGHVELVWSQPGGVEPVPWSGDQIVVERAARGDFLGIRSPVAFQARVAAVTATGEVDITPEAQRLRAWECDQAGEVHLMVSHLGDQATPIRVDTRTLGGVSQIPWEVVPLDGSREGARGTITHDRGSSGAAWIESTQPAPLTDPTRTILPVPPEHSLIIGPCTTPTLVAASTRPPGLIRRFSAEGPTRKWFPLRPVSHQSLVESGRFSWVRLQRAPKDDVVDADSSWEQLLDFDQPVHRLLVPAPDRGDTIELVGQREEQVFLEDGDADFVTPKLRWARSEPGPGHVEVSIAGQSITQQIFGLQGQLELPTTRAGRSRVRISAPADSSWFLDPVKSAGSSHRRRFAARIQGSSRISIQHEAGVREAIAVRVHRARGESAPLLLIGRWRGLRRTGRPSSEWTERERHFLLESSLRHPVRVLEVDDLHLDSGRVLIMPLGDDLAAGLVELELTSPNSEQLWFTASRRRASSVSPPSVVVARTRRTPDVVEREHPRRRFQETSAANLEATAAAWRAEGLEARVDGDSLALTSDAVELRWRPGPATPLALTAPHARDDLFTAELARAVFEAGGADIVAWARLPRAVIDLSHDSDNLFHEMMMRFAREQPEARIIELHGFSKDRRTTAHGRHAAAILSNASRTPGPSMAELKACLDLLQPSPVRLYGDDVTELGGLKNALGRAMARAGLPGFVHLELSLAERRRLLDEDGATTEWARCMRGRR